MTVLVTIYYTSGDYKEYSTEDDEVQTVVPLSANEVVVNFTNGDKKEFHNVSYSIEYEKEESDINL